VRDYGNPGADFRTRSSVITSRTPCVPWSCRGSAEPIATVKTADPEQAWRGW